MKKYVTIGSTQHGRDAIKNRYYQEGEAFPEKMWRRVCDFAALDNNAFGKSKQEQSDIFYKVYEDQLFTGAGRQLTNCGGTGNGNAGNCFAQAIEDSKESIFDTLKDMATIESAGGGSGINFSYLRPKGMAVKGVGGISSGPLPFIDLYDTGVGTISQGGTRRGAFIAILNVDHPNIEQFIEVKSKDKTRWTNMNVSVGIVPGFMEAVEQGGSWNLQFGGEVFETIDAQELWNKICTCARNSAEPGLLFFEAINDPDKNPYWYATKLDTCNPCSELPLPTRSLTGELESGMCCLGSLILPNFYNAETNDIEWDLLEKTVETAVWYLDSLIDATTYPLELNEKTMKKYRPIGLGFFGLADLLFLKGLPYGDYKDTLEFVEKLMGFIKETAYFTSGQLAAELGHFPAYDEEKDTAGFRRNATLLSFAPTGTISAVYGASWGIEPYYAVSMIRNERLGKHVTGYTVLDNWKEESFTFPEEMGGIDWPSHLRVVQSGNQNIEELKTIDHLGILEVISNYTCASVSKTINMSKDVSIEEVSDAYKFMWRHGIKGGTVYRDGCRDDQPITVETKDSIILPVDNELNEEYHDEIEFINLIAKPRNIPNDIDGAGRYRLKYNPRKPSLYIILTDDDDGPLEIFFNTWSGTKDATDGMATLMTSLFRRGIDCFHVLEKWKKYESSNGGGWYDGKYVASMLAGVAMVIEKHFKKMGYIDTTENDIKLEEIISESKDGNIHGEKCPACGMYTLIRVGSCPTCMSCPYSECG